MRNRSSGENVSASTNHSRSQRNGNYKIIYVYILYPLNSVQCGQKSIKDAYHVICHGCAVKQGKCEKCLECRTLDQQKAAHRATKEGKPPSSQEVPKNTDSGEKESEEEDLGISTLRVRDSVEEVEETEESDDDSECDSDDSNVSYDDTEDDSDFDSEDSVDDFVYDDIEDCTDDTDGSEEDSEGE